MQKERDLSISEKIADIMKNKAFVINADRPVGEIISVFANFDLCIGMRLHSLIYATVASVPTIGLVYDPKVSGFLGYTNQKLTANVNELNSEELCLLIDKCMSDYDSIVSEMKENYLLLHEKARLNASLAVELYEK